MTILTVSCLGSGSVLPECVLCQSLISAYGSKRFRVITIPHKYPDSYSANSVKEVLWGRNWRRRESSRDNGRDNGRDNDNNDSLNRSGSYVHVQYLQYSLVA